MGYKVTERNETIVPGPGAYNVRSKLRSEQPEYNESIEKWTPKKKKRKMKFRKKKRKTKSRAETTRSK